jgi:ABC-2 type transport system ATP-binding protein
MNAIQIENFSKTYSNGYEALKNVSFNVPQGSIFALLGPNGAGKTTLIKTLLGIVSASSGNATILGENYLSTSIRKRISYLPENHKYPLFLSGSEVLYYFGAMSGIEKSVLKQRIPDILKLVNMHEWSGTKIKKYSKGMMQRIGLAQALVSNPDLIFLDEPTDGIDPMGRREIHDILKRIKNEGKTVFINSHMLAEVESVCDYVAILKLGELIRIGTVEDITTSHEKFIIDFDFPEDELITLLNKTNYTFFNDTNHKLVFQLNSITELNEVIDLLRLNRVNIKAIYNVKSTLEDKFIQLVKEEGTL